MAGCSTGGGYGPSLQRNDEVNSHIGTHCFNSFCFISIFSVVVRLSEARRSSMCNRYIGNNKENRIQTE